MSALTNAADGRQFLEGAMRGRFTSARGMSLVEATIILMVLAVLTSIIAPSAGDYIEDARHTKAKEDVEMIGSSIYRLLRDTGGKCLVNAAGSCTKAARIDLFLSGTSSDGNQPAVDTTATFAEAFDPAGLGSAATDAAVNWHGSGSDPSQVDYFQNQFINNSPAYASASYTAGGGPRGGIGWRGPYVANAVDSDPWGYKYQANTMFLGVANDATAGITSPATNEGSRATGWFQDVFVLSSGGNGIVQTPWGSEAALARGAIAKGDDIIYVFQNSSR